MENISSNINQNINDIILQSNNANQYVTFMLDNEEYGVEILKVQEIIGYIGFTKLPNMPTFIKGVLNLRGTVVPVIDLRRKFHMENKDYDKFTVIMILEVAGRIMGIIVDSVSDVINLDEDDIQPTPSFSTKIRTDFIKSLGKKNEKFIIMLDMDRVLSEKELEATDSIAE